MQCSDSVQLWGISVVSIVRMVAKSYCKRKVQREKREKYRRLWVSVNENGKKVWDSHWANWLLGDLSEKDSVTISSCSAPRSYAWVWSLTVADCTLSPGFAHSFWSLARFFPRVALPQSHRAVYPHSLPVRALSLVTHSALTNK
jgi:hypothetical protein